MIGTRSLRNLDASATIQQAEEIADVQRSNQDGYFMRPFLALFMLLVVLYSSAGHAGETDPVHVDTKACHLKSIPIEHWVNHLTIHPDTRVVAYTFIGEIGAPGGFRAINYASGGEVDALPARAQHYVHMKISPSGKRLAFAQTEKGDRL